MTTSVESLGVDLGTKTKQLGAKEKTRRKKCEVRFSLTKKNIIFEKSYMRFGREKVAEDRLGPCESVMRPGSWYGVQTQVEETYGSTAAGKMEHRSRDLEVEEELSTIVTLVWAEGRRTREGQEVEADLRGSGVVARERTCRSPLGIKWPCWHTLMFEGQVAVDLRVTCPQDVQNASERRHASHPDSGTPLHDVRVITDRQFHQLDVT